MIRFLRAGKPRIYSESAGSARGLAALLMLSFLFVSIHPLWADRFLALAAGPHTPKTAKAAAVAPQARLSPSKTPAPETVTAAPLMSIDFKDTDVRDVLRALAAQQGVNIIADPTVADRVTIHLTNVTFEQGLKMLLDSYGYVYIREGNIYQVTRGPEPISYEISVAGDQISLDAKNTDLPFLLRQLSLRTGANIVTDQTVSGRVTIRLANLALEDLLTAVLRPANVKWEKKGGVYLVSRVSAVPYVVNYQKQSRRLSVRATDAEIGDLMREITAQTGYNIVLDRAVFGRITATLVDMPVDKALTAIVESNGLKVAEKDGYYLVTNGPQALSGGIEAIQVRDGLLTIRVKDADLQGVIRTLSAQSGLNIISDKDARGPVSGSLTNVPLKSGLQTFFEANGFTMAEKPGAFVVRRGAQSNTFSITVRDNGKLDVEAYGVDLSTILRELSDRMQVNLVTYNYVRAQVNNVKISEVTLDEAIDYLLKGTTFSFKKVGNTYLIGDGTTPRPDSFDFADSKLIRLKYISTDTLPSMLMSSIPSQNIRFMREQNSVLVTGSPEFIKQMEEYLQTIDVPNERLTTDVVRVQYLKAEDILALASKYFPPQSIQLLKDQNAIVASGTPEMTRQIRNFIAAMDAPSQVRNEIIVLDHIKSEDVPQLLPPNIDKNGILVLKEQNSVVATGNSTYVENVRSYLKNIDKPNPQILFDVLVVEYMRNNQTDVGGPLRPDKNGTISFKISDLAGIDLAKAASDLQNGVIPSFTVTLNALVQAGKAKVLANPKISALNGQAASFQVVTKSRYWDPRIQPNTSTGSGGAQTTQTITSSESLIRDIDTGITLNLKPWVSGTQEITMEIEPKISNSVGTNQASGLPTTNERSAKTTIRVKEGNTVIIGGLIQNTQQRVETKVPVLGSIPLLGWIFRTSQVVDTQSEFVIYITPHLITGAADANELFTPMWKPEDLKSSGASSNAATSSSSPEEPVKATK
ncbi:MAG: secretin and TonB N-terminal domain-containing protein [Firmicutes bacterium]|nr:secretin and TonB N-terminal domain-containing protein [Bacillota bacterium]